MNDFNSKNLVQSAMFDDPRFRITPIQQMCAALVGGITTATLMTPLDVVKIRLQAQQTTKNAVHKCFVYCNGLMDHICPYTSSGSHPFWYRRPSQFSGTLDAFVKITKYEGIGSLWSGLSPTLVLALPATVVYFVIYEQLRSRLNNVYNRRKFGDRLTKEELYQPSWVPLISGCTARTFAVVAVSPLELIRTKMQSEKISYYEMNRAIKSLIYYHGIRGLWKGVYITLLRDVPFSGIYWVCYEKIKSRFNKDGSSFFYSFLGGSVSGLIAAMVTNPFDVVKTVYQIDLVDKQIMTEPPAGSTTVMTALRKIYTKNGITGLFAGLAPRLVKVMPACAIMVASFEYGKYYFYRRNVDAYMDKEG